MSDDAIIIRNAVAEDVPFIKSCIHELAEYEHSAELDKSTEEMLHENIFVKGFAKVLIAECNGEKAGFALWFNNFSTWLARPGIYLEDLYVRPQFRRKGIGKRLLKQLAEIAVENGWGRVEWACLKWNKPSMKFYESLGAVRMAEWVTLRVDGENLEHLGRLDRQ
ncbi:MAG: GNAT family N-acetyltransferase [Victivallales bacterium]|nr:GNAT family N-acetyltransferase [Victivallales bacterium]